jgi:hypothetical protein
MPSCRELFTIAGKNQYLSLMKLAQAKALEEGYQCIVSTDAMDNILVLNKLGFTRGKTQQNGEATFLYFYNWAVPVHLNADSVAMQPNI